MASETWDADQLRTWITKQYEGAEPGPAQVIAQINVWLDRGDGVAVFENHDLGHPDLGQGRMLSFGSRKAMIEPPPCKASDALRERDIIPPCSRPATVRVILQSDPQRDGEAYTFDSCEPCTALFTGRVRKDVTIEPLPNSGLPAFMPDFPGQINWRYVLVATYRGEPLGIPLVRES